MRKHNNLFPTCTNNNPPCPSLLSHDGRCIYEGERPSLSSGQSYSFTKTDFISCETRSNGGAIYLHGGSYQSSTSLEVSDSSFTKCYANEGAGIYVNTVASITVSFSSFFNCGNSNTERGGGICMWNVNAHEIKQSIFLSLNTSEDAGALFLDGCTHPFDTITVKDSCFLLCKCTGKSSSSGGALEAHANSSPKYGNCLFTLCMADVGGGGIWVIPPCPSTVASFSFFHRNKGTDICGHDSTFDGILSNPPFFHCFSTTTKKRVGQYQFLDDYSNWLPLGTLFYLNIYRREMNICTLHSP